MIIFDSESINIMQDAVKIYGQDAQMQMLVEECAEVIQAVCKYNRKDKDEEAEKHLCEEVADAMIMLTQAQMMLDEKLIAAIAEKKIERLKTRLSEN